VASATHVSESSKRRAWLGPLLVLLLYPAMMLLCVRQWGSDHPWDRLDLFSGGYVALSLALFAEQSIFRARFTPREEISRLFYSLDIDPGFQRWSACLGVAESAVFLDYGHWRLVPVLDHAAAKVTGLAVYLVTIVWLIHVDRFLFRNFVPAHEHSSLLTSGPYRLVRHPRYTGLLFTRLCFALMLASPIAWSLCVLWIVIIRRRIHREEQYLRARYGRDYELYAERVPQLIPGLRFLI
jgi:protein-S-isoprenylcysteine O-methyltransferase Ste14